MKENRNYDTETPVDQEIVEPLAKFPVQLVGGPLCGKISYWPEGFFELSINATVFSVPPFTDRDCSRTGRYQLEPDAKTAIHVKHIA